MCEYTKFQDGFVHAGIKTAAQWFIDNLLDKIKGFLSEHQLSRLTLVGHSLGGATCSVLTMMLVQRQNELLQRNGEPIEIYCYAFAAPPAVSLNLAKRHEPYISTFVAEDDAVCRLSYGHMMDLKSMLISAIELENSRPTILGNMWASVSFCCLPCRWVSALRVFSSSLQSFCLNRTHCFCRFGQLRLQTRQNQLWMGCLLVEMF